MYTINEVAEICDLSAHTLRFYDKEGLLPFISRSKSGKREFSERDLELVKLICCLKNTGMPIKEIKHYIDLFMEGDDTFETRKQLMIEHRKEVLRQMSELKKNLNIIDLKIAFYNANGNDMPS
ncbi:DNA-binding transcriptional MerR regulator [Pullulanibacillus pueri]|uniref:MerR family transcriptional regulator n=1 Tax=Pullulanibacillus pueri TaxID=1437324 RepID=A0A8J2ZW78_9BACL|nr:MerR family transcriptional regulator [Pullulanibacillus pueri]MBM7682629.1 DNA-binding transcriptional MerR regulator [Pullulanibacillus pueri]GGH82573.1 MerR family transcriptional regulator [Pullulanibacillus pueri]